MTFSCPNCSGHIEASDDSAGMEVNCPHCSAVITAPVAEPPPYVPQSMQPEPRVRNAKLTNCRDCGREVSLVAYSCPHCGATFRRKHGVFYYVFVGTLSLIGTLAILIVALLFFGVISSAFLLNLAHRDRVQTTTTSPTTPPTAPQAEPLTAEETQLAEQFIPKLKTSRDDVEGITWHQPPEENILGHTCKLYIGTHASRAPWLRFHVRYYGDSWVFIDQLKFKIGDELITLTPRHNELHRNNSSGSVWETYDVSATDHRDLVERLLSAENVTLRFSGNREYVDYNLSAPTLNHIKLTFLAYRHMGGPW